MNEKLSINGKSLNLRDLEDDSSRSSSRKASRRIFELNFFSTDEKHEIGNNYRDFKNRKNVRRRKSLAKLVKISRNDFYYREVLQIPCFRYPRFSDIYPYRGRQTICEYEPPDEILNHTVRRIKAAYNLDELKNLIQRQACLRSEYNLKSKFTRCPVHNIIANSNRGGNKSLTNTNITINPIRSVSKIYKNSKRNHPQVNRPLGYIPSASSSSTNSVFYYSEDKDDYIGKDLSIKRDNNKLSHIDDSDDFESLIELASECYDEGFQSHLSYLESIGDRSRVTCATSPNSVGVHFENNIPNESRSRSRELSACSSSSLQSPDRISSSGSINKNNTSSADSTSRIFSAIKRLVQINRPRVIKRYRKIHIHNYDENTSSGNLDDYHLQKELDKIVVSAPSSSYINDKHSNNNIINQHQQLRFQDPIASFLIQRKRDELESVLLIKNCLSDRKSKKIRGSMNNSLTTTNNNYRATASATTNPNNNINELIHNLCNFQISAIEQIPKIILTDFSTLTSSHPDISPIAGTSTPTVVVTPSSSELVIATTKQPVNFELSDFDARLEIPNENNYHSEARPP